MTGGEVPVESVAITELSGNTADAVISVITENLGILALQRNSAGRENVDAGSEEGSDPTQVGPGPNQLNSESIGGGGGKNAQGQG
eukprot:2686668-Ditylum_brightwellii.AAC.1